ncbi:MAG: ATP-binding cassette subfamily F protein uup, partial [Myxococcota bacterium]
MKSLIAQGVEKSFGNRHILRGCTLSISAGERIGLVGANGSGKTTLVRILAGDDWPDHGEVRRMGTMAWLAQDPVLPGRTVGESLREAVGWHATLLDAYSAALEAGDMEAAGTHQDRLDLVGWEVTHRIEAIQDRLRTPENSATIATLSGGELRRVALARALLAEADVLLLDEPTNHLDAETVVWLEGFLAGYRGAVILVTHDRYLLEAVANRIVEIESGECVSYDGSYTDYLIARAEHHSRLEQKESRRLNMLAREAAWAARSPSARSTKQKARLKRLEVLQGQKYWTAPKEMALSLSTGEKFGGTVLDVQNLSKSYGDNTLLSNLSFSLAPGDRLGIVGVNGAGKSTLLRMLLGEEAPDGGDILTASRVTVGVLDQARTGLTGDDSVFEAAGGGNDHVWVNGVAVHVTGFLERFLFTREHLDQRVDALSGGERARLLLA